MNNEGYKRMSYETTRETSIENLFEDVEECIDRLDNLPENEADLQREVHEIRKILKSACGGLLIYRDANRQE